MTLLCVIYASLDKLLYRRLHEEENNPGYQTPGLNEAGDISAHATDYVPPQNTVDNPQLVGYRHPSQRINNSRSPQLHVTTLNSDHTGENPGAIEDTRAVDGGEVVGYLQGYGPCLLYTSPSPRDS